MRLCGTVYQDTAKIYPTRLLEDVSIKIIDLQEKLLSSYDRRIAEYATEFFQRANIECLLNTAVKEVKDGVILATDKVSGAGTVSSGTEWIRDQTAQVKLPNGSS